MLNFCDTGLKNIARALIARKMSDGKRIDDQTVLDSLARVIPMLEEWDKFNGQYEDLELKELILAAVERFKSLQ